MNLNFTISEFLRSSTAKKYNIDNTPDAKSLDNLLCLIFYCLQPLRNILHKPIRITSGYRSLVLNKKVGGVSNSQHLIGQAADLYVKSMTITDLYNFIKNSGVEFDQLIHEGTWVHISYNKGNNRKQAFVKK